VQRIAVTGSRATGVELADGRRLSADAVVVAAGPWTKRLISDVGYELPIFAERHEMVVLDAGGHAREFMPFSWCDDLLSSYARPDGDRVVLAGIWAGGGTGIRNPRAQRPEVVADFDHFRESLTEDEIVAIMSQLVPRFPRLAELGLRPGYAALYDMSPDDHHLIGPVPGVDGLYVVCGSSGHGFKMGAAVGEEVARLVATKAAPLLTPFRVERFAAAGAR
jgi:sarcosine oxidase subunit beta